MHIFLISPAIKEPLEGGGHLHSYWLTATAENLISYIASSELHS